MVDALRHPNKEVTVALVGKYTALHDAYISVVEALKHGGIAERATVNIKWVGGRHNRGGQSYQMYPAFAYHVCMFHTTRTQYMRLLRSQTLNSSGYRTYA